MNIVSIYKTLARKPTQTFSATPEVSDSLLIADR